MLRKLMLKLKEFIDDNQVALNQAPIINQILEELENDIENLKEEFGNTQGTVDLYHPDILKCGELIEKRIQLLKKYRDYFEQLEFTLMVKSNIANPDADLDKKIQRFWEINSEINALEANKEVDNSERISLLKKERDSLAEEFKAYKHNDNSELDIVEMLDDFDFIQGRLKLYFSTKRSLDILTQKMDQDVSEKTQENEAVKLKLTEQLQKMASSLMEKNFVNPEAIPMHRYVAAYRGQLEHNEKKYERLQKDLPYGFADVKRVILMAASLDKNAPMFSTDPAQDKKILELIEKIRLLMKEANLGGMELFLNEQDPNLLLHKSTKLYWEQVLLFSSLTQELNDLLDKEENNLTTKGQHCFACIAQAIKVIKKEFSAESSIQHGLHITDEVDGVIQNMPQNQSRSCEVRDVLSNYIIVERTRERSFTAFFYPRIVPLIKHYNSSDEGPFTYLPFSKARYRLDFAHDSDYSNTAGNCYGETCTVLAKLNMGATEQFSPSPALLNLQIDQSRTNGLSPQPKTLEIIINKDFISWDEMKPTLTSSSEGEYGDMLLLKLDTELNEVGLVTHTIGIIKLKNPNPYAYMIHDMNFGLMGFSSENQLQHYLAESFKAVGPYVKANIIHIGDVTKKCVDFISAIKPMNKPQVINNYTPKSELEKLENQETVLKNAPMWAVCRCLNQKNVHPQAATLVNQNSNFNNLESDEVLLLIKRGLINKATYIKPLIAKFKDDEQVINAFYKLHGNFEFDKDKEVNELMQQQVMALHSDNSSVYDRYRSASSNARSNVENEDSTPVVTDDNRINYS